MRQLIFIIFVRKKLFYLSTNLLISLLIVRNLVIVLCTARFNNILKSAFCPLSIFVCFLLLLQLTTITSLVNSIGIATDCGLDGPGSNSGRDKIFRLSRPALRHTQLPVQWVPGLSQG